MSNAELRGSKYVTKDDILSNFSINFGILENTPDDIKIGLAYHEGSSRVDLQACKLGTGRRFTTS